MTTKIVYFLFGIALSAIAISGVYIFGMRVSRKPKEVVAQPKLYWQGALANMKQGKWFSYLVVTTCLVLTTLVFTGLVN